VEIAVISGKGGTGKSSISAVLASASENVVVADCDVDAADMYLLFDPELKGKENISLGKYAVIDDCKCTRCGKCKSFCRFDAIVPVKKNDGKNLSFNVDRLSCEGCGLCTMVCEENAVSMVPSDGNILYSGKFRYGHIVYGRLFPGGGNSGKFVDIIKTRARKIAKEEGAGHIILDGPPGIGCPVMSTLGGADAAVIVTEPTISGLSDIMRLFKVAKCYVDCLYVIINKYDLNPVMAEGIESFCNKNGIPVIAKIPFDKAFVEAMIERKTLLEYAPSSLAAKGLRKAVEFLRL
jgi:MinD superfamily P-loop ATPase